MVYLLCRMHQRTQITVGIFKQFHSKESAAAQDCEAGGGGPGAAMAVGRSGLDCSVLLWMFRDLVGNALY